MSWKTSDSNPQLSMAVKLTSLVYSLSLVPCLPPLRLVWLAQILQLTIAGDESSHIDGAAAGRKAL